MSNEEKTVIVLGPARSGTSLAAGMAHTLGYNMNPKKMGDDGHNPRGGFEDVQLIKITAELKQGECLGLDMRMHEIIFQRDGDGERWGFKSALTHHCLDDIFGYFHNPVFIVTRRDLEDNAKSWQHHMATVFATPVTDEEAIDRIAEDYKILEAALEKYPDVPRFDIQYEKIKASNRAYMAQAKKLAAFLDVSDADWKNRKAAVKGIIDLDEKWNL